MLCVTRAEFIENNCVSKSDDETLQRYDVNRQDFLAFLCVFLLRFYALCCCAQFAPAFPHSLSDKTL